MSTTTTTSGMSEPQFAEWVDVIAPAPSRSAELAELLREDHPCYDQRGAATVVRMRGWVLLALARGKVSDAALLFVLEELDTGTDPYLVAAAARALRAYPRPSAALAPFVLRALAQIRYRDEAVSFASYGEYATTSTSTSPVREMLATLEWLGPHALGVLPEVEALRAKQGGLPKKLLPSVDRAVAAIGGAGPSHEPGSCCALPDGLGHTLSWALGFRRDCEPIAATVFEDHAGASLTFREFFQGQPSIVVFFYTRCDNPLKCSLTVAKLAKVQQLLEAQGLAERIHTAAITYDPEFDLPERLRGYGQNRGVRLDAGHRMLRATAGIEAIRRHFQLGVNFIESLVNRHRIEAYILDAEGRIAASFARLHWDEQQVVDRARQVAAEQRAAPAPAAAEPPVLRQAVAPMVGTVASLAVAFFPKCPICWAGYLSLFGIAGVQHIADAPWLQPVLILAMGINVTSVWLQGRLTGRMGAFCLVVAGAIAIAAARLGLPWEHAPVLGVALTLAGSMWSAASVIVRHPATVFVPRKVPM